MTRALQNLILLLILTCPLPASAVDIEEIQAVKYVLVVDGVRVASPFDASEPQEFPDLLTASAALQHYATTNRGHNSYEVEKIGPIWIFTL